MAIEFPCPKCGRTLRVPDETAGRTAQCPACGGQAKIPQPMVSQPSAPTSAPLPPYSPPSDPFASANPYAAPMSPGASMLSSQGAAQRLSGPSTALVIWSSCVIALSLVGAIIAGIVLAVGGANQAMPVLFGGPNALTPEQIYVVTLALDVVGALAALISLLGGLAMKRRKGYGLAILGAIAPMVPLSCTLPCCLVVVAWPAGLGFGIWSLTVLMRPEVKAAFT